MTDADPAGDTVAAGTDRADGPALRARRAPKGRRGTTAPASRVLTTGLSIGAACAIVTALAMSQPGGSGDTVELDVTSDVSNLTAPTTSAAPPPTTIVINRIYVPVPAGGPEGTSSASTSGGTRQSSGGTASGARPSSGAASSTPAPAAASSAPVAAPTPAPAPAPAAKTRAS